mgnify:CR=1 FL=1
MSTKRRFFVNGRVVTPEEIIKPGYISTSEGIIEEVGAGTPTDLHGEVVDLDGDYIVPGYIDIHIHGAGGADMRDGNMDSIYTIAKIMCKAGVTSFVPTLGCAPPDVIVKNIDLIVEAMKGGTPGAQILGVNLEGPYISPGSAGSQPPAYIRNPNPQEYMGWLERTPPGFIKLAIIAPELLRSEDFIKTMTEAGVVMGVGHSMASYEQVEAAVAYGLSHSVHTFNGDEVGIRKQKPGVVGASLNIPEITCELIADGHHVHRANMELLYKLKGPDRVILVSDGGMPMGLGDGIYTQRDGRKVVVEGGRTSLEGSTSGNLAGSVTSLDKGVKNMVDLLSIDLVHAVRMASTNPARRIGVSERKGSIAKGMDADFAILSSDFSVRTTVVSGEIIGDL